MDKNLNLIGSFSIKNLKVKKSVFINLPNYYEVEKSNNELPLIKAYTKGKTVLELDCNLINEEVEIIELINKYNEAVKKYNMYFTDFKTSEYIFAMYTELYFGSLKNKFNNRIIPSGLEFSNNEKEERTLWVDFVKNSKIDKNNRIVENEKECNNINLQKHIFNSSEIGNIKICFENAEKIYKYNEMIMNVFKNSVLNVLFIIKKNLNNVKVGDRIRYQTKGTEEIKEGIVDSMDFAIVLDITYLSFKKETVSIQFEDIIV